MAGPSIRTNNFDLVRLFAALQVVVYHSIEYLRLYGSSPLVEPVLAVIRIFPGVLIFFFVSGFLISRSYESSATVQDYARNRLLRIYPALIVCTLVSVAMVAALGYLPRPGLSLGTFGLWLLGQMTIVQFFNPAFMRDFGVGVLNGSLWTITVELQFYVLVPLLYLTWNWKRQSGTAWLSCLIVAFVLVNAAYWRADPESDPSFVLKLLGITFAPWFYMFLLGVLAQRHFDLLHRWLAGRALLVLAAYAAIATFAIHVLGWSTANDIHPVLCVALSMAVVSVAFTRPLLADRLLRRNDISYGVYIYHMPIINGLLYLGLAGRMSSLVITVAASVALSSLSWRLVEKPCLSFKRGGIGHTPRGRRDGSRAVVAA